ncbi:MAG TPA: T9SS type A sorting domain-containing protein [Bacteroidia bacterium]|nr:T9SS type A sorting domain-containing protein [Bacteroidia bacterium]HNU32709.1 T9SS type A sorting domain-containing protein [Bacteroidia bacterium]
MKKIYTLILIIVAAQIAKAQFSIDVSQPMQVCSSAVSKENMQTFSAGGNHYVFWRDKRNGSEFHLYGQRFNSNGVAQWTANGKLIVAPAVKSVSSYHCSLFDGGILVSWIQASTSGYGDSVMCKKINFSGNNVWAQPTLLAESLVNSILYHETYSLNAIPNDSGAFINYSAVFLGGSSAIQFNRIDFNGVKQWSNPKTQSLPGYTFFTHPGNQNTFYSVSRGNGVGTSIYVQKYNLQSVAQWASPLDVTQGVSTNGFGGSHYLFPDNAGNIYMMWQSYGSKIFYTKIDAIGNFVWTPQIKSTVSLASTAQSNLHALYHNNNLYITWNDNRITNQATVFTQKYNSAGVEQWTTNGVQTGIINGYYGYPKIAVSDSNAIFCTFMMGVPWEVNAQRIRSNGTLTWASSKVMANGNAFVNYNNLITVSDTNGCNAVFWEEFSTENLFGAKICSNGNLVKVDNVNGMLNGFEVYPNPASDVVNIQLSEIMQHENLNVSILNVQGREIFKTHVQHTNSRFRINLSDLSPGIYFIKLETQAHTAIKKLVVQ